MKNRFFLTAVIVVVTIFVTIYLHIPASLLLYKIREPYFERPVISHTDTVPIRNDGYGNGEYASRRRNGRTHAGIDILAPVGTPVYAAKSGIAFRGEVPTGYGKYIMIYHPDGYQTYYGHLSGWKALSTAHVRRGELIGYAGKTGNARSKSMLSHLHFEIRKDGEPQDPRELMR
jgi:murein DD-endopeptidase MepM/ murein hydrolase activator NlpD